MLSKSAAAWHGFANWAYAPEPPNCSWKRCGVGRSVEGSGGLAPEPPADRCGLALDRCASSPDPAVVWLERGATADRSGIRHARHGIPRLSSRGKGQLMAAVMIGVDPHKGSHTAVAIGTSEEVLGQVRVRASAAQAAAAAGLGEVLAGTDLGGRGRRRPGAPAVPAAGRRRGAGAGRAAQAGSTGPAAGQREREQERPRMTRGRWPSRRCGRRPACRCGPRTTRRC